MSGGQPAHATVVVGAQSAQGSPPPGHELQSQPMSRADSHQEAAPQPALTVIMPSGKVRQEFAAVVFRRAVSEVSADIPEHYAIYRLQAFLQKCGVHLQISAL